MTAKQHHPSGFTLVELLIAMAVSGILLAAIYSIYQKDVVAHANQKLLVDMMQNARAAMTIMTREIRMAGYNPSAQDGIDNDDSMGVDDAGEDAGAGFVIAGAHEIGISMNTGYNPSNPKDTPNAVDIAADGEYIRYGFAAADDADGDGLADFGVAVLGRNDVNAGGGLQPLTWDVVSVGFAYAVDSDADGELDTSAGGNVLWLVDRGEGDPDLDISLDTNDDGVIDLSDDGNADDFIDAGDYAGFDLNIGLTDIRAVQVWLLVRTRSPLKGFDGSEVFVVGDRIAQIDGGYKGVLLNKVVRCRNL